jgi:hypothetical protein
MRRGWLRRNRLITTLPHFIGAGGFGFRFCPPILSLQAHCPQPCSRAKKSAISLVKSLSGGLGLKTRRSPGGFCRALRIGFTLFSTGIPLMPTQASILSQPHALRPCPPSVRLKRSLRNRPENTLTTSGGNIVTRYSMEPDPPKLKFSPAICTSSETFDRKAILS